MIAVIKQIIVNIEMTNVAVMKIAPVRQSPGYRTFGLQC
jgi:hypothetical protein